MGVEGKAVTKKLAIRRDVAAVEEFCGLARGGVRPITLMALGERWGIPRCNPRRALKEAIESWDDFFLSGSDNGKEHEPFGRTVF